MGACPACRGFGRSIGIDLERAIPDRSLSIYQGVVKPFQTENGKQCQRDLIEICGGAQRSTRTVHLTNCPKADQNWVLQGDLIRI